MTAAEELAALRAEVEQLRAFPDWLEQRAERLGSVNRRAALYLNVIAGDFRARFYEPEPVAMAWGDPVL